MKQYLLLVLWVIILRPCLAQKGKIDKTLKAVYNQAITPGNQFIDENQLYQPTNQSYVFAEMKRWMADTSSGVRLKAVSILSKISLQSSDTILRGAIIQQLVLSYKDTCREVGGLVIAMLPRFTRNDFGPAARDSLLAWLNPATPRLSEIIKLVGYLHIYEAVPVLRGLVSQGIREDEVWASQFALARLGDERSEKICARMASQNSLDNIYVNRLLPDLVYTHSKYVYNALLVQLNKDENGCSSPNPYYEGKIPCTYRILEAFCGKINGYPLQTARWGDLVGITYPKALKQAREWFAQNPNYTIIDTAY